jgi:hypothetical protein
MYLTAQHVQAPGGAEGINAFRYAHGADRIWEGLPPDGIPDRDPGSLVARNVVVPPPGNRIRSYLDIVAPDDTSWSEIRSALIVFLSEAQRRPFPWVGVSGRAFFRVGLERALSTRWQREIAGLVHAVRTVP